MHETFSQTPVRVEGVIADPAAPRRAHREVVTPGYFDALGMTIVAGRRLVAADTTASERVLVVNEVFAAAFLADRDPLAHRVMVFGDWARIVGVVRSKRHAGLRSDRRPELFIPLAQAPPDVVSDSGAGIIYRANEPMLLMPAVRRVLRDLQPMAAIENEGALDERIWTSTAQPRFFATVMGVFAALAMVTALVGLFGVLSYIVERRRVEIGVRRALGATSRDISRLVLGRGLRLLAIALPLGLACSAAGVGLLRNLLFGVAPVDPTTIAVVGIAVPVVALAACIWPARRAVNIAPIDALREE
jgi:putative ABC transport system permease protein